MKKSIGLYDFRNEFSRSSRSNNFSYEGLEALYNYLTDLEDDIGEEIEFDLIEICCDYTEYESFEDIQKDYNVEDMEELENNTTVIKFDNGFIIQCY
jgi:hypothetical protein